MIRDQKLIDKLIADLHFHNFMFVNTSNNIYYEDNEHIDRISELLNKIRLNDTLNPYIDFYHGGTVSNTFKERCINSYIDDVFIDYFFRTHHFEKINFPKGFCFNQITPNGIIKPSTDINLNLNNIYDRCTFIDNIWRLFVMRHGPLFKIFSDKFIGNFYIEDKVFGLHSRSTVLITDKPFYLYFDEYIEKKYQGNSNLDPISRGKEIYKYIQFIKHESDNEMIRLTHTPLQLHYFRKGYLELSDNHLFGNYTLEDILFIYSLLVDKFTINEDSFLLPLCFCLKREHDIRILDEFIDFEINHLDYHDIEPFIVSNDLYLRFASHTKSKAFSFTEYNDVIDDIYLFNRKSTKIIRHGNTIPLPYLYSKLSLS